MKSVGERYFPFHRCICWYLLFINAIEYNSQIMITFTHCSLAMNFRDVTIKHVHSEKHREVNRWVVALFKVLVCGIGGKHCLRIYTVLWIIHPRILGLIFIEIDVNLGSAVNCRKTQRENACNLHQWLVPRTAETPLAPGSGNGASICENYNFSIIIHKDVCLITWRLSLQVCMTCSCCVVALFWYLGHN